METAKACPMSQLEGKFTHEDAKDDDAVKITARMTAANSLSLRIVVCAHS